MAWYLALIPVSAGKSFPEKKYPWEDELSEHHIRGRIALFAAEFHVQGSHQGVLFRHWYHIIRDVFHMILYCTRVRLHPYKFHTNTCKRMPTYTYTQSHIYPQTQLK